MPIPRGRIHAAVDGLDHIVRDVMRRSGAPGVAVAVVQGDRVLYAKGFSAFAPLFVNPSELAGKTSPAHPVPANADAFYVGTYANDYFGDIQITSPDGSLHLIIGPEPFDYPLEHWDGNLFAFFPTGENALGITAATFNPNAGNSQAASVTLEYYNGTGLGTFVRE